MKGTSKNLS